MKEGWRISTLGECCQIKPPKKEVRDRLSSNSMVSFVPMNKLGIREKELKAKEDRPLQSVSGSYTYFADGDVLLAKITPCFENGKLGIAVGLTNGVGFGSSEFVVFRPNDVLDAEYLFYFLCQDIFRDAGANVMSGAVGHKRVPKEFIQGSSIPLPSFPEQKRIVAILDEAFAGIQTAIANTEKNLANARELFESYLNSVFSQRGEGWVEKPLSDVCQFENGDRGKNYPKRTEYVESGIPWINTGHIQENGTLSMEKMNYITKEKYDSLRSGKIQAGDLVYCLRGATLGKTAFVEPFTIGAVASSLVIIRPRESLDNHFLYYFLTSPIGQGFIKLYDNGAAQPNLGAKSVAKYVISQPPLSEQKRIARKITDLADETQRLESIYQQKLTALAELKQSLLQKAFSGELTIDKEAINQTLGEGELVGEATCKEFLQVQQE